jgi:hypothetical protein
MSTDTVTSGAKPSTSTSSLASSTKFRTFAVTFGIVGTIAYNICLYFNWPLFTFHPATNRFAWGFEAARSGEGPNMTWYGWTAATLLVAAAIGRRISLTLLWLLPWLAIPLLIWDLRQWWFHK